MLPIITAINEVIGNIYEVKNISYSCERAVAPNDLDATGTEYILMRSILLHHFYCAVVYTSESS